ncbi:MAG: vanadium-dependent haloperoxidase [Saprospiraceae bacterium]|nr:vanadium-dependent haloperoxidase [Saprospiraceae bacterium]
MKKNISLLGSLALLVVFLFAACNGGQDTQAYKEKADNPEYYHRSVKKLTDVIVHDIFSPPVASRIYAYSSVAGYEALRNEFPEFKSFAGQLNGLDAVPQPEAGKDYCFPLAAVHAFLSTGRKMIFSEDQIEEFQNQIYKEFKDLGMSEEVYNNSIAYGTAVHDHIMKWSSGDMYSQTRTYPKYTIDDKPNTWKPTPPAYMDGIEPSWRKIRPMVLDSAQQFVPPPPTPFDLDKGSLFYKELMEVYTALQADDKDDRLQIAQFWDCNPFVSHSVGHVMYATKKISPGGHWIGITETAAKKAGSNIMESAEAYAQVSIALMDAFISCWDEKYRSNLIRPETVINTYIDEDWMPALQTPPFPEYTSGHSVISRAAAIALTDLYGDNFAFVDSVEVEYGLPARSFDSFLHASSEAAVSRLYGGIHYRPAIDNGVMQGEKVGKFIVANIDTRNK